jgi:protein-tyrosine-phosphatase
MRKLPHRIIWAFGLGYFAFYAPYSALTKAITSGAFRGVPAGLSGFELLPATILGTLLSVPIALTLLGWWRYLQPMPRAVVVSGIGTSLIIACTTLAYTFSGVSIVLALLLMRGGVLILAPLVDVSFGRNVRWFSWVSLVLALGAVVLSLSAVGDYKLVPIAAVNLGLYLTGYVFRLTCMTKTAKIENIDATRGYFVQELAVAMVFLAVIGVIVEVRNGFLLWRTVPGAIVPALLIGALYTCLYFFGTLIYLDRRENTFCIALNRGSSMLAGLAAAFVLSSFTRVALPPQSQIAASVLIIGALVLLSPAHHLFERSKLKAGIVAVTPRRILFVCSGNTCRSPMAAAIANAELALRARGGAVAESAGLSAHNGAPMTAEAQTALAALAIRTATPHFSRRITQELIDAADVIYTMTAAHRDSLIRVFPTAAAKSYALDPAGDIADPIGHPADVYDATAARLRELVRVRFDELGLLAAG